MVRGLNRILLYDTCEPWEVRGGRPHPHASFGVLWPGVGYGVTLASLKLELAFLPLVQVQLGWLVFCFA